ncbi:benzoate/H(+) symporter BenE family transporter [Accumulibacter sp.]|uniref:benzoate/H(+) symporter BenE family transporter n=1 Tax=Accumulibacter sp. TaxID=2053492 RepID=UPI0025DAF845|nr:benzoate/H(+) symporter BenE family transporter [Accumulibacter sp.]MCM8610850.1 benzoate/H(+) symporter BenE family transporter [Accumulibacter sp.]MCM8635247.1 benzoate/H(+) symporter BenE family transporter [Accumulibacter sp.]MCM8638618.1 benzoate/H(+) symporter BenE family transporter [Accumulibacter sp.]
MRLLQDCSLAALTAGFVAVLVGFTSSAVIVFQAARTLQASPAEIASWMLALGLGMGLSSIGLSLRFRVPVLTAWSTPGAAMLITGAAGVSLPEATGAFLVSAVLITVCGFSGWFERMVARMPLSIASGMLAGVLLRFGLDAFGAMASQFALVFPMFCAYLVCRRSLPRYAIVVTLLLGIGIAGAQDQLRLDGLAIELAAPVFIAPRFSWTALVGVALPLFVVTMASQNVPGVAVIRASGYRVPISPLIGWTGAANLLLAPFGGFALNLAAITAAICMGREAHEDPGRRYVAAIAAGAIYVIIGVFGATVGTLFLAMPRELVLAIAGFALLGTIGSGLASALVQESEREPALLTFLVTASGVSLASIGSAFWGLLAGLAALFVLRVTPAHLRRLCLRTGEPTVTGDAPSPSGGQDGKTG